MELTRNFTLQELTKSDTAIRHGIDNNPNADQIEKLKTLPRTKGEEIVKPRGEEQKKLFESQRENMSKVQPVTPAAPFLPDPQIANMFAANIDPTSGLTQTESALLSPEEQIIAKRLRT